MTDLNALLTERILVSADEKWKDRAAIERELIRLDNEHTLILIDDVLGLPWQIVVERGMRHSTIIAPFDIAEADRVLLFCLGTGDAISQDIASRARTAGIPVTIFDR